MKIFINIIKNFPWLVGSLSASLFALSQYVLSLFGINLIRGLWDIIVNLICGLFILIGIVKDHHIKKTEINN